MDLLRSSRIFSGISLWILRDLQGFSGIFLRIVSRCFLWHHTFKIRVIVFGNAFVSYGLLGPPRSRHVLFEGLVRVVVACVVVFVFVLWVHDSSFMRVVLFSVCLLFFVGPSKMEYKKEAESNE